MSCEGKEREGRRVEQSGQRCGGNVRGQHKRRTWVKIVVARARGWSLRVERPWHVGNMGG